MDETGVDPIVHRIQGSRWRGFAYGVAIVVCGMAMGGALTLRFFGPGPPPPPKPEMMADRLKRDLDLTAEQTQAVLEIFTKDEKDLEAIRIRFDNEMKNHFGEIRRQIERILTPEQARIWNEHIERMEKDHMHTGPLHGPPMP